MAKSFTNILTFIDAQKDPNAYYKAAIRAANLFDCHLHLLIKSSESRLRASMEEELLSESILALQNTYQADLKNRLSLHIHIIHNISKAGTIAYLQRNNIDLIIHWNGTVSSFVWPFALLRCNLLARDLACPVLLLPKNADVKPLNNIILPVERSLSAGKMVMAVRLARKFGAKIHLLGLESRQAADDHILMKACQLLRNNTNITVECHLLKGKDVVREALKYGPHVNAGILLSCSGTRHVFRSMRGLLFFSFTRALIDIPVMVIPREELTIL